MLTRKAKRTVEALDACFGLNYYALKKAVLEAYGTVPEAYRSLDVTVRGILIRHVAQTGSEIKRLCIYLTGLERFASAIAV